MRKLLLLPLILLLVACGAPAASVTLDQPAEEDAEPTAVSEEASESQAEMVSGDSITPAKTAAEAGAIRDRDWTKGAEDPLITIIEYGDFQ
jgi:uncharacterized protein YcfL